MVDLIEKQATINAIRKLESGIDFNFNEGLICAMNKIDEMPPVQPHWVPCSERLPETNGEMYLVTISKGSNVYVSALQWDTNQKYWYLALMGNEEIRVYHIDGVIAWSAMPEPYKEV